MLKIFKSILISFVFIFSSILNSYSLDISTILRNQQLTVFDIGVFRLQEDLKKTYTVIKQHSAAKYEEIYLDVVSSWWRNSVDMLVSIPMKEGLDKSTYMSDSFRCRNIFNSVRDHLLKDQNLSNYRYTMATSYLTSIFSTPSNWPKWRYDPMVLEELVNLVRLEVTLYPTPDLAFSNDSNPVSCKGGLETETNEIVISMKYN